MNYSIGLDIGISSVGWAVINLDKKRIEDLNSRMFDRAENPKDGASLAAPRREARSARRTIRRRRYRVSRIRKFMIQNGLLSEVESNQLFKWIDEDLDIWIIRVNGVERKLTDREFARMLIHYAKNRGFKSNRKSEAKETEIGALLSAVKENTDLMKEKGYRTVAEMLVFDEKFKGRKRNKEGDYSHVLARYEIENEIRVVFEKQREFGHRFASKENEEKYLEIWSSQRPFSTSEDIFKKIGNCTFEQNEKRAPKLSYTFEQFRALDSLNRLRIISNINPQRSLLEEERNGALKLLLNRKEVKYKDLRRTLQLQDHEKFNELFYDPNETIAKNENRRFLSLEGSYQLKKVIRAVEGKTMVESYRPIDFDTFAYAVTVYKDDNDARDYLLNTYVSVSGTQIRNLANRPYGEDLIEGLLALSFSQFGHLSLKALTNILPYVEEGYQYHKACEKAGYNFNQRVGRNKKRLLPVIPGKEIGNPVVIRSLSQTRKVLNGIIKRYGSPSAIYIEMARDMGRPYNERKELEKSYNKNRTINENAKSRIRELHPGIGSPRGHDIAKYKLWEEQNGRCAYSLKPIPMESLLGHGTAEVDHIIPYSRCFDDSNGNKVLVLKAKNQNKGDRTPFEWFGSDQKRWEEFTSYVTTLKVRRKKKDHLLKENFDEDQAEQFKSRHLNDTRYITRFIKTFIEDNLKFREEKGRKQYVYTVNGAYTSLMRKRWGFNKDRDADDLHHALDAVLAAVSLPFRHRVSNFFKHRSEHPAQLLKRRGERFPEPWEGFIRELRARFIQDPDMLKHALESLSLSSYDEEFINLIKPIFVSRMPKRSVRGQIHEETIRRQRGFNEKGYMRVVTKTPLENIRFDKNGDFDMYGRNTDPKTYEAIKERYLEYEGNRSKAFSEPLFKPSRKPKNAPIIRSIKIESVTNRAVTLENGAVAANGSIARTKIYTHKEKGGYYLAPVYISDAINKVSPNKFISANKPYKEWAKINGEYEFKFNLYPNDIIRIRMPRDKTSKKASGDPVIWREGFFYYRGVDSRTGSINIVDHMNSFQDRIGSRTLALFEKYQTDPLGNLTKVHQENKYVL